MRSGRAAVLCAPANAAVYWDDDKENVKLPAGAIQIRVGGHIMRSLYDDLSEKLKQDPRLTKRGGARFDMSLLLFNFRDDLHGLWLAADRYLQSRSEDDLDHLHSAVERLRPVFGESSGDRSC